MSYYEARALALRQSLNRSQGLAAEVKGILQSFHDRLGKLEDEVLPVEERCSSLSAANTNLGHTVGSLNELVQYFNVTTSVGPRLRAGPMGDYETYFTMVDRLQEAVDFLRGKERLGLASATEALRTALKVQEQVLYRADEEVRALLKKNTRPVADYGEPGEEPSSRLPPPLPKLCAKLIRELSTRMNAASFPRRGHAYVDGRFAAVEAILRRHGCGPPLKKSDAAELSADAAKERVATFALLLRWTHALLEDERILAGELLHEADYLKCFSSLAQRVLESVCGVAEPIVQAGGGVDKVFAMLEIHEALRELIPELESGPLGGVEFESLLESLEELQDSAAAAARDGFSLLRSTISKEEKRPPNRDGNVDSLSSFVMLFFTRLFASEGMADALFAGTGSKGGSAMAGARSAVVSAIEALFQQLELRSRTCRDSSGRANQLLSDLYLMNNLNYTCRSARRTPALADVLGDDWLEHLEGQVDDICGSLCAALWNSVLAEWEDSEGLSPSNLSPKDRERVKSKFRVLNEAVQKLGEQLPTWIIPDPDLRKEVLGTMRKTVVVPYGKLYSRYANSGFTTNRDKYLKHTPDDLLVVVNTFFLGTR